MAANNLTTDEAVGRIVQLPVPGQESPMLCEVAAASAAVAADGYDYLLQTERPVGSVYSFNILGAVYGGSFVTPRPLLFNAVQFNVPAITLGGAGDFVAAFYQRPDGLTDPGLWTLRGYATQAVSAIGVQNALSATDISLDAGVVVVTVGTPTGNFVISMWSAQPVPPWNNGVTAGFRPTEFSIAVAATIPPLGSIDPTVPSVTQSPGKAAPIRLFRV